MLLKNGIYYSCGQNQKLHISCDHSKKKVYTHIIFIGNCNIIIKSYRILFAKKFTQIQDTLIYYVTNVGMVKNDVTWFYV